MGMGQTKFSQVDLGWVDLGQVGMGQTELSQVDLGRVDLGQVGVRPGRMRPD